MNNLKFKEVKLWKKRIINYYKKFHSLSEEMCAWKWETYKDMIKDLQFMKHLLQINKFTSADFEELIRR